MSDFWVFGYGSLMWRPGFDHVETQKAKLSGYRRSLCVVSHVHRGTPQRPGLVLGLDRGGSCVGLAFRVPDEMKTQVVDYLRARELVTHVYLERMLPVRLADGRRITALTYVCDRAHEQYAGGLDVDRAVSQILGASGISGANEDYVTNTLDHLRGLGIRDAWLEAVAAGLRPPG